MAISATVYQVYPYCVPGTSYVASCPGVGSDSGTQVGMIYMTYYDVGRTLVTGTRFGGEGPPFDSAGPVGKCKNRYEEASMTPTFN